MKTNTLLLAFLCSGCVNYITAPQLPDPPDNVTEPRDMARPAHDLTGVTQTGCEPLDPRSAAPVVDVLPEAHEAPFVSVLNQAQSQIRVMIYLMGYGGIMDTLKAKAAAGVKVQVILDQGQDSNQKYFTELTAAGIECKWSDPKFPYMHAKVIVVDEAAAILSTGNYSTNYSIAKERNFTVTLSDHDDVSDLIAIFEADWNKLEPDLSCTRLIVSPVNARQRILDLIKSAKTSLVIESMQFADTDVRAAVAGRKNAGVDVRVLLADPSWIDANANAATYLKGLDIPVKYGQHIHTKAFVVDGNVAYVGSENFSYTSLSQNREVGVFMNDASSVKPVADTFEADFAKGTSF